MNTPKVGVLGVQTHVQRLADAAQTIVGWARDKRPAYVCLCPVYSIMCAYDDDDIATAINGASMVAADGMPVVWLQRHAGFDWAERVYGPELMLEVLALTEGTELRHVFFGGQERVSTALTTALARRFPRLTIAAALTPPFRDFTKWDNEGIVKQLRQFDADILWVGLGSPKQDLWMSQYSECLPCVMIGVGAAFDFLSGTKSHAPRWIRQSGTEWLFRLLHEPRRLWRRYVIYNPRFVWALLVKSARASRRS